MKSTIIFSDHHLGNNIHHKRLARFMSVCKKFDRIVLNGDFLDDFWKFKETLASDWKPFFELLKHKEVIYLFGNHDRDSQDLRAATSEIIDYYADTYYLPVGDHELVIRHGHRIYPRPDDIFYKEKNTQSGKVSQKTIRKIWRFIYPIMLAIRYFIERFPKTLARLQRPIVKPQNERMKKYAQDHLESHQILVCGHSHYAEFSPDQQFINCGANSYGRVEYLSVINDTLKLEIKKV